MDCLLRYLTSPLRLCALLGLCCALLLGMQPARLSAAGSESTIRVSDAANGTQGNNVCTFPVISADGIYLAFQSASNNLVPNDTNSASDIFVRNLLTGTLERVNVGVNGVQANGTSMTPAISADGRYVAFESQSVSLLPGLNGSSHVFVRDRQNGVTELVSKSSSGVQGNGLTRDGIAISQDGRYVAFRSDANNLVPDDTNGTMDFFVHDRQASTTERINVASDGTQAAGEQCSYNSSQLCSSGISADGRYITFASYATNLVASDTNGQVDVFVYDRQTGITERIDIANDGTQANQGAHTASISADGRYVAFFSLSTNIVSGHGDGIYLRDRLLGQTRFIIAHANTPVISADGLYIVFHAYSANVNPGDTNNQYDVFRYACADGTFKRVSVATDGTRGNGYSGIFQSGVSVDGRLVAFVSEATNLVANDTNVLRDVFLHTFSTPSVSYAADLQIKGAVDTSFSGDNLYNNDTAQTVALSAFVGTAAVYPIKVENDGNGPDSFTLCGDAGESGWTVRYFNAPAGGTDITDQVIGTGWISPALSAGTSCIIRVEVTPGTDAPVNTPMAIALTAVSRQDGTKFDTVCASTTKVIPPLTAVILAAMPVASCVINTPVTLTATPTGGTNVEYRFLIQYNGAWTDLRGWNTTATCTWTPTASGAYALQVRARETGSASFVLKSIPYKVTNPVTGATLRATPNSPAPLGSPITLTATTTGGGTPEYRFLMKDATGWHDLRGWNTGNTYLWNPPATGAYTVQVRAREVGSTASYEAIKSLSFRVTPPITNLTLTGAPTTPVTAGTPVTLTANAIGGQTLEYRFLVQFNGAWTDLKPYSTIKTCTWTPQTPGSYTLQVRVREATSGRSYDLLKSISYTVR